MNQFNKHLHVKISEQQHTVLKQKAYQEGSSIGYIIRECIGSIIMDKKPPDKTPEVIEREDVDKDTIIGIKEEKFYPQPKLGKKK